MVKGRLYTEKEFDFIRDNANQMTQLEMSKYLNRTLHSVQYQIWQMQKNGEEIGNNHNYWTKEEDNILRKYWGKLQSTDIRKKYLPNRTRTSILHRAVRLKLESKLFMTESQKEYLSSIRIGKKHKKSTIIKLINISLANWQNQDYRELVIKNTIIATNTMEYKDKCSKIQKSLWSNQEYKIKMIDILSKTWQKKPTSIESMVMEIIKMNTLNFIYVGDFKVRLDTFYPDFINEGEKKIIEVNGEYHHNLPKVKKRFSRKLKTYKSMGYKTLVIWGKELDNMPKAIDKIVNFAKCS